MQRIVWKITPNLLSHLPDFLPDAGMGNQDVEGFACPVPWLLSH